MEVLLLEQKHLISLRTHRLFLHNTTQSLHTDFSVNTLTFILKCGLHNDLKANKTKKWIFIRSIFHAHIMFPKKQF